MTVFADTPRWPRHGTVWGHLISDDSLDELHAAAARAGLPPRAFDLDHYDWPAASRGDLEAAGVRFVGDRELTRILLRSGLRVKLSERPAARARRSAEHAAALGLDPVPRDLIVGLLGHVDPLPEVPGAFRFTRDRPHGRARIEAHDEDGRRAAERLLERVDLLARAAGEEGFVGQVMDAPAAHR
ncbi:DUF4031 domain-containing protein [Brachybacterium paraconglomeratum]|uniref:DUF4031 domain-containing protein n=1 Tax=Brachybacterium paraconglomeratum TaxID=173362 RepID=UPI0021A9458C|nr:DUF4031 domain-containing protein [Brachybacterium paraconglomeratum]MCT1910396.1 DUF4031 domain-containing protein [Brachybacterium paraconglomeratum]